MDEKIKILIVEDRPQNADLAEQEIRKAIDACDIQRVQTQEAYITALSSFCPKAVVSGCGMSWFDETVAVGQAQKLLPGVPFIVLADAANKQRALACMKAGAWDYVLKEDIRRFGFVIRNALKHGGAGEIRGLSEAASRKQERQAANLMKNLPGMVYRCRNDRSWTMEFVSQGCFALTGYHPEEIENDNFVAFGDLIHAEDRDRVWHTVQHALSRFERFQVTYRLINRQGEERWVWEQGVGVWEKSEWFLDGFAWDITEQRATEKAWRENAEKLRMFTENTNSLVAVFDKDGLYEYASPSYKRLLGFIPEALIGTSGFGGIHPEDVDQLAGLLSKALSGGIDRVYGLEYRGLDKEGRTHYLKGNFDSIRDGRGNLKNIVYVGDDVSDLRQSEDALGKEKEKFRVLMEGSPLGIFLLDRDGRITYVNSKFIEMFGYAQKEIATARDWLQLAYPNEEYRLQVVETWKADMEKVRLGEGTPTRKYTVTCRNGSEKTMLAFPIILEAEAQMVVCQDISRQESLEAQFIHAQKMESIGRLASGIAHDFNNLLTTIIGNADFAMMDLKQEDALYEVVREIKDAADRAANLTRQLLAFSRKQRRHPEVLNLNEKVEDTKKMLKRLVGENIELELMLAPDLKLVEMDPGQVDQVIMNLVVNARDAMPEGGKLTIETANVELSETDPVSPVELIPGAYVLLSMTDTGTGIPREIQGQVFEPFFTTKEKGKGTGLGLSTVYGIIKQNHGNTLIYSEPGKGTTVKIFLPVYAETVPGAKKAAGKRVHLHGTETILLTEDEEKVRKIVMRMLVRYGYSVVEAGNGQDAQRLFRASDQPIKLLLTDMIMPGINGLELARALRKAQPDLKVLCMSGYTDSALFEGVREEGFAFIHKPFTPPTLIGKIRELLDE